MNVTALFESSRCQQGVEVSVPIFHVAYIPRVSQAVDKSSRPFAEVYIILQRHGKEMSRSNNEEKVKDLGGAGLDIDSLHIPFLPVPDPLIDFADSRFAAHSEPVHLPPESVLPSEPPSVCLLAMLSSRIGVAAPDTDSMSNA